jgi:hypothetical protein
MKQSAAQFRNLEVMILREIEKDILKREHVSLQSTTSLLELKMASISHQFARHSCSKENAGREGGRIAAYFDWRRASSVTSEFLAR